MNAPETPAVGVKDYFAAGCLLGILCGALLAVLHTIFQISFHGTGSLLLDQTLMASFFGLQLGIAGMVACSRWLGPTDYRWRGLLVGAALGVVSWLMGALLQYTLWLFSFYITWFALWMGLSLLRAHLAPASFGLGLLRGLLASAVSCVPMSAALIMWAEPNPNRPPHIVLVCLAWFASYALGLGFVFTLAPQTENKQA